MEASDEQDARAGGRRRRSAVPPDGEPVAGVAGVGPAAGVGAET
ncbi:MAG: hypothetical protein ACKOTB_11675 [Planctomycetia bacterium]